MRKLGSKPEQNWARESAEVTAAADFTGHWNKETGAVWVSSGAGYLNGEGTPLAEGVTSEVDAYDAFGAAGYVRYDNLGPTPGMPHVWSCTLSVGNKFASVHEATTIGWTGNEKEATAELPSGDWAHVSQANPYGYEWHAQIHNGGDVLFHDTASTLEEGKALIEDIVNWHAEFGTWHQ